jgi:hypothetical protein
MEIFSQTSDVPYDRHHYEVCLTTGKPIFFDNWSSAQEYWWNHHQIPDYLSFINVLDKKQKKVKSGGFGF